jgi:PAS domain S-box-containing protein
MGTSHRRASWDLANPNGALRTTILVCFVAILSYYLAKLAGMLIVRPQADWPLWLGNVFLASMLLLVPRRLWPLLMAVAIGAFQLYNFQSGLPIRSIAWFVVSDTVEVLAAALSLNYVFRTAPRLDSVKALAKFSLCAVILAPFVGAFPGAMASNGNYWTSWRIAFFSEALVYLTLLPAILGWVSKGPVWATKSRAYYIESAALLAGLALAGHFTFVVSWRTSSGILLYSFVPFLLWAALRLGSTGVSSSVIVIAILSICGATHGRGPLFQSGPLNRVLSLQLFLFFAAAPFMVLAAVVEERRRAAEEFRESEKRFRLVADTAPVLIWMSGADKLWTFFNKGWLDFTGQPMEHELGEGWAAGVHPEDLAGCLRTYSTAFDARVDFEMEYRLKRFDGKYRWIVDLGVPRFEADGTFRGYIGSCVDVTDRKMSKESLEELSGRLITAQEEERSRIARELHDDFSQRLALQGIGLARLWIKIPESEVEERAKVQELLKRNQEISSDMHSLSHQLHSSKLEHVGLVPALMGLCQELSSQFKIQIEFTERGVCPKIPKDVALCLFRVAQEALANVVRHSRAKQAQVELSGTSNGIRLQVVDAGEGFDPDERSTHAGIGLVSMRERLRLVGGELSIRSARMRGTEILTVVPLSINANEAEVRVTAEGGLKS